VAGSGPFVNRRLAPGTRAAKGWVGNDNVKCLWLKTSLQLPQIAFKDVNSVL
jgi:hypothetical protein